MRVPDFLQRRDLSSGLIYTSRNQARLGLLSGIVPALPIVAEARVAEVETAAPGPQPATSVTGLIRIDLPSGVRVSVVAGNLRPVQICPFIVHSTATRPESHKSLTDVRS